MAGGRGKKGMTPARRERAQRVVVLRDSGATWEQIGKQVGVSPKVAHEDYDKAMEEARPETATRVFGKIDRRLERLHLAYWKKALDGDMKAARLILDIEKELAELWGVKGAVRVEVDTAGGEEWQAVLESIRKASTQEWTDDELEGSPNEPLHGDPDALDEGR